MRLSFLEFGVFTLIWVLYYGGIHMEATWKETEFWLQYCNLLERPGLTFDVCVYDWSELDWGSS